MGEVIEPGGEHRDTPTRTRNDHQRGVQSGDANEEKAHEQSKEAWLGAARRIGGQHGHGKAQRHAPTVAEEDLGRRAQVVGQESQARPAQRGTARRDPRVSGHQAQRADASRGDQGHRAGRSVHVVEQVEGVDHADDPDAGDDASSTPPEPNRQPRLSPASHAPRPNSNTTRSCGDTVRRSSMVPITKRTATAPSSSSVLARSPVATTAATANASKTAVPPKYGVGWA